MTKSSWSVALDLDSDSNCDRESTVSPAIVMIAWSRIWSPIVPDDLRDEAWAALELPDTFTTMRHYYWSLFHVGSPSAPVPTLLHAALGGEGSAVREDWMRAIHHLGLRWNEARLAPDQLGVACEVYACALERDEHVLVEELRRRYLEPWCVFAIRRLEDSSNPLAELPLRFAADLESVATAHLGRLDWQGAQRGGST